MKVGIIFGGPSREREISFAGGRTVYDNLDKALFEPVPVFVDSLGNFILLDWQFIYKGTIRDFYPPVEALPESEHGLQIYLESLGELSIAEQDKIIANAGKRLQPNEFKEHFDFAFLALHGPYGEDGSIQGLLEWYHIPYSGSGILPSAIGIDKAAQKKLLKQNNFATPDYRTVQYADWAKQEQREQIFNNLVADLSLPLVLKAPHQGSSIGVSIIKENNFAAFEAAMERSFFTKTIYKSQWLALGEEKQLMSMKQLVDIREGIGMPVMLEDGTIVYHPEELLNKINHTFNTSATDSLTLTNIEHEQQVLVEAFIRGKEFSCIVVQNEAGEPIALPPTEIVKGSEVFDYRSKYLPGLSRKITPINLPTEQIQQIRKATSKLFKDFGFNVYARLDGFITDNGEIFLNDPNTTSGMLPSSFFFHQAAEIGLNPSQFLTYIIRTSVAERLKTGKDTVKLTRLLNKLDKAIKEEQAHRGEKVRVGVIMGGYSSERHISVESGRNIYEKLSSSTKYEPLPIFLTGSNDEHRLYTIPINIMLKDNADDIKEKVHYFEQGGKPHPVLAEIAKEAESITRKYTGRSLEEPQRITYSQLKNLVDAVFIALHGRPGEDGALQTELEKLYIPYNGSGIRSSRITINKYETNEILAQHGVPVAKHAMAMKEDWEKDPEAFFQSIENEFKYPFIAKPADDGCSSAVKKIKNRQELQAFAKLIFREMEELDSDCAVTLQLGFKEEFPNKAGFLVETLISREGAKHFLEITGGLLTKYAPDGTVSYEVFEASEALAEGEVLSLEEKFLAGEGQNITPARYAADPERRQKISDKVKEDLRRVAQILNIEGYARIDAFVRVLENDEVETIIIEVNSLPGMTPATCIFHQTAINGYKPYDFIDRILQYGMERTKMKAEV
ncbi:D-alanine--D-alanine ligase family protein [Pontibacter cellulosilyticus]|uniref:D-alanine--D-alanine ligase n=1 Tax=Pontibacter cellulosilyticus TaxID=1720253 RepID=A0A923SMQ9_9BACT|nr:D-alanine--D-alanine ligase [Pontibacter cellulosilyticus]MBC5992440.1 D-alanine--D-alanine ligase [Pontibacter cellulosilyticus]